MDGTDMEIDVDTGTYRWLKAKNKDELIEIIYKLTSSRATRISYELAIARERRRKS